MSLVESLIQVIAPSSCKICNSEGSLLCTDCVATHITARKPACFWCNTLTPKGQTCTRCKNKTSLSGAIIPFRYEATIRELIYALKYDGNREVARLFAGLLSSSIDTNNFDVISFVPTTGVSQRKRGYNQAQLIANQVGRLTGLPLVNTLLRNTHIDQIGLNRTQRLEAVKNNFTHTSHNIDSKRILLVDDVITTGATIDECASTLKKSGAKQVWALAIAKK